MNRCWYSWAILLQLLSCNAEVEKGNLAMTGGSGATTVGTSVTTTETGGTQSTGGQSNLGAEVTTQPALDGRCAAEPTLLVDASTYPLPSYSGPMRVYAHLLAVHDSYLYYSVTPWQNVTIGPNMALEGSLMRVPVGGGQPAQLATGYVFLQKPAFTASSLVVSESNAYPNSDYDRIVSIPLAGGAATPIFTFTDGGGTIAGPIVDENWVYFADQNGLNVVPLSGSASTSAMLVNSEVPNAFILLGDRILEVFPQGEVGTVPLPVQANSPLTTIGTCSAGPDDLISCGADACWVAGELGRVDPSQWSVSCLPLPPQIAAPIDIAFDGSNLYAIGGASPLALARLSQDDTTVHVIATMGTNTSGSLAVDDECLYFVTTKGIYSVNKTVAGPFAL